MQYLLSINVAVDPRGTLEDVVKNAARVAEATTLVVKFKYNDIDMEIYNPSDVDHVIRGYTDKLEGLVESLKNPKPEPSTT